ncbi:hypothetical protein QP016_03545 [Gallibacterium anatis]|uniref:Uncharacterized protein n=1 Tax=Gallibacterium anatis TaxID=750 RepID=A0A921HCT1_9PAST|nr:hypothetical protein [Gallibacterium anatis]MDK9429813.1 hypothetical protein [Gallibacterium anatis]WIM80309.1 hypothetical protein QP018_03510 [Gallibacterium anatis]HJF74478.1 hypothetical protein [Gallibacterium anatis]
MTQKNQFIPWEVVSKDLQDFALDLIANDFAFNLAKNICEENSAENSPKQSDDEFNIKDLLS